MWYSDYALDLGPVMYEDDEKLAETLAGPGISVMPTAGSLTDQLFVACRIPQTSSGRQAPSSKLDNLSRI